MKKPGKRFANLIYIYEEGNVLFNDTLSTFYLWLYGVGHVVKDRERKPAVATWAIISN